MASISAPSASTVSFPVIALRALLLLWAGFWAWFVVAVSLGEKPAPPVWIPLAWLGGLAAVVAVTWRRPAIGGLLLLAGGAWLAYAFPKSWPILAAPALVLGVAATALARYAATERR
jgi:hypothetical protein